MKDDELLPRPASGLEVLGEHRHRLFGYAGPEDGGGSPADPTLEKAEERSVQHRRERAESVFADPLWPVDQVISWIGYRDVEAIEKPFRAALYRDSHPVVESRPRIALLIALQTDRLRAIRRRGQAGEQMSPEEWAFVERQWPTNQWPDCRFRRSDVIDVWPPIPAPGSEIEPAVVEAPSPAVEAAPVAVEAPTPQDEAEPAVVAPRKRGRPPGTGNHQIDQPYVEKALKLLKDSKATSRTKAVEAVWGKTKVEDETNVTRILRRLREAIEREKKGE